MAKTMKKLSVLFMAIALCTCLLVGCSLEEISRRDTWTDSGFTVIDFKGPMDYVYHNETKVIYVFIRDGYQAGLTALLNPDGTPMIWEGE
jgi:hypothetical protein